MRRRLVSLICCAAVAWNVGGGHAAERPFDAGLMRLSEVLGSLHFLVTLCGGSARWRQEMEELLAAEKPDDRRRAVFVARFNRGYQAFAVSYRQCTPSADAAIELYLDEGKTLTRGLADRFGN